MIGEYSELDCPKCSNPLATRTCGSCGGEGYFDDEEEEYWGGDERCETCNGKGHEEWSRDCGWDVNYQQFLSPEYERAYEERLRMAGK